VTQSQTKTVQVFDPQGRPLGRFSTGTVAPSSVALRSPDARELFLTGEAEGRTRNGKVIRLNLGK
jgi:sugar lactone lactonase YvrE